jgi:carbonic anhydrase/acetyltransferase-like protein (isoleucine patch superfamily)
MKLIFDHKLLKHINESAVKERGRASSAMLLAEKWLGKNIVAIPLSLFEHIFSFLLTLPIPIYSSLVYALITHARGLPHYPGMYLRALYYRRKLGHMESNVFIDQNVFFAYPRTVELKEFSYIDKGVMLMSRTSKVGRRVHIAPRVFISGGGDFEIEDYACIATNSNIITSTEILKDGARCSGPMVSPDQRQVLRGRVLIKKDAFIGANVTILPDVTVAQGSVAAAGITVSRSTEDWGIYLGAKTQKQAARAPVMWPDD